MKKDVCETRKRPFSLNRVKTQEKKNQKQQRHQQIWINGMSVARQWNDDVNQLFSFNQCIHITHRLFVFIFIFFLHISNLVSMKSARSFQACILTISLSLFHSTLCTIYDVVCSFLFNLFIFSCFFVCVVLYTSTVQRHESFSGYLINNI